MLSAAHFPPIFLKMNINEQGMIQNGIKEKQSALKTESLNVYTAVSQNWIIWVFTAHLRKKV